VERIKLCNSNIVSNILSYNIIDVYDNSINGYYEYYFDSQHNLINGESIDIYDPTGLFNSTTNIYFRNQIKIGINNDKLLKWRYVDNSNDWQDIDYVTTTEQHVSISSGQVSSIIVTKGGYLYDTGTTTVTIYNNVDDTTGSGATIGVVTINDKGAIEEIEVATGGSNYTLPPEIGISNTDKGTSANAVAILGYLNSNIIPTSQFANNFEIQFVEDNNKILVSVYHTGATQLKYQELIGDVANEISSSTQSEDYIVRTLVLKDNYIRVNSFTNLKKINITKRESDSGSYHFYTDYLYNYTSNEYYDILTNNSNVYITYKDPDIIDGSAINLYDPLLPHDWTDEDDIPNGGVSAAFSIDSNNDYIESTNITYIKDYIKVAITVTVCPDLPPYFFTIDNTLIEIEDGEIINIPVGWKGYGYETAPTVTISGGGGTGATAHAELLGYSVDKIVIDTPGSGYTSQPTVTISTISSTDPVFNANVLNINNPNVENVFIKYDLDKYLFKKEENSYKIVLPIDQHFSIETQQSDLITNLFTKVEKEKAINPIIDNERTEFKWYYKASDGTFVKINILYLIPILLTGNIPRPDSSGLYTGDVTYLREIGFMDDDFKYQKQTTQNTFLTMLYYNDMSPTNQDLEYYSISWLDYNIYTIMLLNGISSINLRAMPSDILLFMACNPLIKEYNDLDELIYGTSGTTGDTIYPINKGTINCGLSVFLYGKDYMSEKPTPLYLRLEFNNAKTGKKHLLFNRASNLTYTNGVPMDNVFFDKSGEKQYCYTKLLACFNKDLNEYIIYPDSDYFSQNKIDTKPFYSKTGYKNGILHGKFFEAYIE
jgi:hypothetical protein